MTLVRFPTHPRQLAWRALVIANTSQEHDTDQRYWRLLQVPTRLKNICVTSHVLKFGCVHILHGAKRENARIDTLGRLGSCHPRRGGGARRSLRTGPGDTHRALHFHMHVHHRRKFHSRIW